MNWWLVLLNLMVLGAAIWQFSKYQSKNELYRYFWAGYLWKLMLGLLMGYWYAQYLGGGDTWTYFEDASTLARSAAKHPAGYLQSFFKKGVDSWILPQLGTAGEPRALFMVKLLSVFAIFTASNYWLMSVYLSTLSFMGIWLVAARISESYPGSHKAAAWAFLFMPSVIFWSSGISKESVFMGAWGFMVSYSWPYFKNWQPPHLAKVLVLVLLVYLMYRLKYYYMAVILPVGLTSLLIYQWNPRERHFLFAWIGVFLAVVVVASWLHPNLYPHHILEVIKTNAGEIALKSSPQALIKYQDHQNPLIWSFINFPKAFFSGLLRPYWGDWAGIWQNLAIVENGLLWILGLGSLSSIRKGQFDSKKMLPVIIYIAVMAAFLALATPNLGTLSRYKVVFMPVLVYILLFRNPWWKKLEDLLP
ncbi:MAG: hypothetical protein OER04_18310 [Cyclobacteriaceae bacterium]|nr:hypothetical protein [Cyclobacteriaceae bacterium]